MIAVAQIGGHQAIVSAGEILRVDKIKDTEPGAKVSFDTLLIADAEGKEVKIGTPFLDTKVEAKVLEHGRDKKITVFKMKPRKRYRRTLGHRQDFTVIEITKIGGTTTKKVPAKKAEIKAETKSAPKKAPAKKATPKKTVAKKPTAKKSTTTKKTSTKKA